MMVLNDNAEKIIEHRKSKRTTKAYIILIDGVVIQGFKGKFTWVTKAAAEKAAVNNLLGTQWDGDGFTCAFREEDKDKAAQYIEDLKASGRLIIKEIKLV